jgi:hypothetical protein
MLTFHNPGTIDPLAITTLGINVKADDTAIGYFGTGLKYSIARILAWGGKITIWNGLKKFEFASQPQDVRGKSFEFILMNGERLGFTTDLGKNWEPWMVYRELYCNAKDEGGDVLHTQGTLTRIDPKPGQVTIQVNCPRLDEAHAKRHEFILSTTPIWANDDVEFHPTPSSSFFYKNIKIFEGGSKSAFTFNFREPVVLTEDRTANNYVNLHIRIAKAIGACTNRPLIREFLHRPQGSFEATLDLDWGSITYSEEFLEEAAEAFFSFKTQNHSLGNILRRHAKEKPPVEYIALDFEIEDLEKAKAILTSLGFDIAKYPIRLCENSGTDRIFGYAKDSQIFLFRRCFDEGLNSLCCTLLEEFTHLETGYLDCTRELQDNFLRLAIRFGRLYLQEKSK